MADHAAKAAKAGGGSARGGKRAARPSAGRPAARPSAESVGTRVAAALAELERQATRRDFDNLERFGIAAANAFGVSMANIQALAKRLGRDHELAVALWETGQYEARLLVAFVGEPERLTAAQMDRWCREFDNWGVCDTLCFKLFDRSPLAWRQVEKWSASSREFVKRAGFALMASLAGHDRTAGDAPFLAFLPWIEEGANDDRNFVKKGVSWALRRTGRRSRKLHAASLGLATRLAVSADSAARWVGRDALRDLGNPRVRAEVEQADRSPAKNHRAKGPDSPAPATAKSKVRTKTETRTSTQFKTKIKTKFRAKAEKKATPKTKAKAKTKARTKAKDS